MTGATTLASADARRQGLRPNADRTITLLAVPVILAATTFRTVEASRTWFYQDDLKILGVVARDGLGFGQLFTPYLGHLMPAGKAAAWVINQWPPYDYTPVLFQTALMVFLLGWAGLRMLVTLFGPRPAVLLLLAYLLFNPWLIEPTAWWAAGINHYPALIATCLAVGALVRHLRAHRRRDLVASVAWILTGLAFAELALLAYVPMAVLLLGYFSRGTVLTRTRDLARRYTALLVAHSTVVVAYLALYLSRVPEGASQRDPVPWRGYLVNMFTVMMPSGFTGGPTRWSELGGAVFRSNPPSALHLLSLVAIGGVFALSALTRVNGLRAWLLPGAQIMVAMALLAQNRAIWGPDFILDPRATTVLSLAFTLALGLAFLPVPGAVECAERRARSWIVDRWEPPFLALVGFVVLAIASTASFPLLHVAPDPRDYMRTVERSLEARDEPVQLVDLLMDTNFVGAVGAEYSIVLAPYGELIRTPTVVQGDYYVLDKTGRFVRPGFDAVRHEKEPASQDESCRGYAADSSGEVTIPLDGPVLGYVWRLRMSYRATGGSNGRISFGGTEVRTTFADGKHVLETSASAPETWDSVRIDELDPATDLCITRLEIGTTTVPGDPDPQPGVGDDLGDPGDSATAP